MINTRVSLCRRDYSLLSNFIDKEKAKFGTTTNIKKQECKCNETLILENKNVMDENLELKASEEDCLSSVENNSEKTPSPTTTMWTEKKDELQETLELKHENEKQKEDEKEQQKEKDNENEMGNDDDILIRVSKEQLENNQQSKADENMREELESLNEKNAVQDGKIKKEVSILENEGEDSAVVVRNNVEIKLKGENELENVFGKKLIDNDGEHGDGEDDGEDDDENGKKNQERKPEVNPKTNEIIMKDMMQQAVNLHTNAYLLDYDSPGRKRLKNELLIMDKAINMFRIEKHIPFTKFKAIKETVGYVMFGGKKIQVSPIQTIKNHTPKR